MLSKALDFVLKKLKDEEKNFKLVDEFVGEPELDEKTTLYGGFIEATVKFEDAGKILGFIVDYTPTSIEVEDPDKVELSSHDLTVVLNDMSSTILRMMGQLRAANAHIHHLHKKFNIDPKTGEVKK
jgi:hypothetical protein